MKEIARGKEKVLAYLEKDAENRSGKKGEYLLTMDEADNLVAIIAGRTFIGTGSVKLGDNRLIVVDGIVINIQDVSNKS